MLVVFCTVYLHILCIYDLFHILGLYDTCMDQWNVCLYVLILIFFSWRDSSLVGLGLLLIHEDFCGF